MKSIQLVKVVHVSGALSILYVESHEVYPLGDVGTSMSIHSE